MEKQDIGSFSLLEHSMRQFESEVRDRQDMRPAEPFPKSEMTENKRLARVVRAEKSFWEFDNIYYPESMYSQGYSPSGKFHKDLLKLAESTGVQIIEGSRKTGKTVTFKKILSWFLVTGRHKYTGTMSSTMPVSSNILKTIYKLIGENPRILNDFHPEFIENNSERFALKIWKQKGIRNCVAFSEGVSLRGASEIFDRITFVLCDDLETRLSPLGDAQVDNRIRFINETYDSMADDGTLVILGNNFDEKCALNRLKKEQEDGTIPEKWHVHVFPAWNGKRSLWPEKYPVKSEAELRKLIGTYDESTWQGDFMQNPVPPEGVIFKRQDLNFYDSVPKTARGVIFCDPNLAKKSKGDSTAVTPLVYSGDTDRFYFLGDPVCRSFDDSNKLLDAVLSIKERFSSHIYRIGFDGNVTQESTWSQLIRHWCKEHNKPYYPVEFCHYDVDKLAKNAQALFEKILFPRGFADTADGRRYLEQLFAFAGKKARRPDDAPDSLISAVEFLMGSGFVRQSSGLSLPLMKLL